MEQRVQIRSNSVIKASNRDEMANNIYKPNIQKASIVNTAFTLPGKIQQLANDVKKPPNPEFVYGPSLSMQYHSVKKTSGKVTPGASLRFKTPGPKRNAKLAESEPESTSKIVINEEE